MRMWWLFLLGVLVVLLPRCGAAMVAADPQDQELALTSDVIVVGTVAAVTPPTQPSPTAVVEAQLTVEQVLKGPRLREMTIHYPAMPPGGMILSGTAQPMQLKVGQRQLFCLQRDRDGNGLIPQWKGGAMTSLRPADDTGTFTALLQQTPATATFTTPVGTLDFAHSVPMSITLKNTGDTPIQFAGVVLEAYYLSPRIGRNVQAVVSQPAAQANADAPAPTNTTLDPGAERTIPLQVLTGMPESWHMLTPDTYLLTPIIVRARVRIQSGGAILTIPTPWQSTLAGYPMPAGEE